MAKTYKLDETRRYPPFSPVCSLCARDRTFMAVDRLVRACDAFEVIPDEIWLGQNDHTKPYPGDRGFQFQDARDGTQR